jgi:hypothetical protein
MTSSYLNGTTIKIPETFDSKRLKATLAECIEIDQWSRITFANEHALATVLEISDSKSAEGIAKSRLDGERDIAIPFLRRVPTQNWVEVTGHDGHEGHRNHSTAAMALVRGIRDPRSSATNVKLTSALLQLSVAEVDLLARALVNAKKGDVQVDFFSVDFARKLFQKLSNDEIVTLYGHISNGAWVAAEALTDKQLSQVWANAQTYREHDAPIFQERLRRGQLTPEALASHLELGKGEFWRSPAYLFGGPTVYDYDKTLLRVLRAHADIVRHAGLLVPDLRTWLLANIPKKEGDLFNCNTFFLVAWLYDPSVEAWFVKAVEEGHKTHLRKSFNARSFVQGFARAFLFHRDPDSVIKALRAIKGKTMNNLLDQVEVELRNTRTVAAQNDIEIPFGSGGPATQTELIVWASTPTDDAMRLLKHHKSPMVAILQGIESTNPVAILNAACTWDSLVQHQRESEPLPPNFMEKIFIAIDTWYGPDAPEGATLQNAIGFANWAYRLREVFTTAVGAVSAVDNVTSFKSVAQDFLFPLLQRSTNERVKVWLAGLIREYGPKGLVPPAETLPPLGERLATLTAELAAHPSGLVPAALVERGDAAPGKTTVNRLYGPPIGVSEERWPTFGKKKMVHLLTLETQYFTEALRNAYQAKGVVAIAVFISNLMEHKAFAADNKHTALVQLSASDLKLGAKVVKSGDTTKTGLELVVHAMRVPNALFKGGVKKDALLALRGIFNYRSLIHLHCETPKWIQQPDDAPAFHFDFDEAFASEVNMGDEGRMYVFRDTVFIQCT